MASAGVRGEGLALSCKRCAPAHSPAHPPRPHLPLPADQFRGASALVRMASVEAAERAITALNNTTPPGAVQTLIVRYAESAAEKAARLSRREKQTLQRTGTPTGLSPVVSGLALPAEQQLHQTLSALSLNGGSVHAAAAVMAQAAGLRAAMPPAPLVPQPYHPAVQSSVCIKGGCSRFSSPCTSAAACACTRRVAAASWAEGHEGAPPSSTVATWHMSPPLHHCVATLCAPPCLGPWTAGMPGNADRLWLYENFAR